MLSELSRLGIEANAIDQPIDLSIPENKIMLGFYLTAPDVENERRSLAVIRGMRQATREGRFVAKPPKGYTSIREGSGKPFLAPNGDAPLVRRAFKMASEGTFQLEEIRKYLRSKWVPISRNQMSKMLRNPVYGAKLLLKEYRGEPEELIDAIHEPIVTWAEFQRVQVRLRALNSKRRGKRTRTHASIPLRGYLQCRRCGGNLTGGRSRGNGGDYWYYHCRHGCKERIAAAKLDKAFDTLLQQIRIPKEICDLYELAIEDVFKENEQDRSAQIAQLRGNLVGIDERLIKIDDLFVDGKLADEAYRNTRQRCTQQRESIEGRIETLSSVESQFTEYTRFGISPLEKLPEYYRAATLEAKRKIAGSIFPGKLIYENDACRTTEVNPAITLFSPNMAEKDRYGKGHDSANDVMPLQACLSDKLSNRVIDGFRELYQLRSFIAVESSDLGLGLAGVQ